MLTAALLLLLPCRSAGGAGNSTPGSLMVWPAPQLKMMGPHRRQVLGVSCFISRLPLH